MTTIEHNPYERRETNRIWWVLLAVNFFLWSVGAYCGWLAVMPIALAALTGSVYAVFLTERLELPHLRRRIIPWPGGRMPTGAWIAVTIGLLIAWLGIWDSLDWHVKITSRARSLPWFQICLGLFTGFCTAMYLIQKTQRAPRSKRAEAILNPPPLERPSRAGCRELTQHGRS